MMDKFSGLKRERLLLLKLLCFILLCFGIKPTLSAKESPFLSGEKIVYKIFYNWNFVWLSAGEMVFEVKDEGNFYHIEATGMTYSSYEWFYKVRDKFHTYIDKKTLRPILYIRDIHEGSYDHYEKIIFDYSTHLIHSHTGTNMNTTKLTIISMQEEVNDLISTFYHLRSFDRTLLKSKSRIPFKMILDNEIYNLNIICENESKLSVKESGDYNVLNCLTQVIVGNTFRKNTSLKINVADDENKLPVLIESPLSVGSVKAILKSYEKLKYPFSAKY
ncbi:MAG: DUF3108 domain-containing protein [Saprospiraceae bacterium]